MDMRKKLEELVKQEEIKFRKYILFMLLKFSELVKEATDEDESYLPLIIYNPDRLVLVYQGEDDDFEYIFNDYEEILIILQKLFNENRNVFLRSAAITPPLPIEEIYQKIDEAVDLNDTNSFQYYTDLLSE